VGRAAVRELVVAMRPRYQRATKTGRGRVLDEFCAATGYHRVYARALLRGCGPAGEQARSRCGRRARVGRPRVYGRVERELLQVCWELTDGVCSKRLAPFLGDLIARLARLGALPGEMTPAVQARVSQMSAATIDRLLRPARAAWPRRGRGTTKPGSLLRDQVPIRDFAAWDGLKPGFLEIDLVAHCGTNGAGAFTFTLSGVDVATGWISLEAVRNKSELAVFEAFERLRARLPFPLLGIDCDNGGEFINRNMVSYCTREGITLTRSRPYRKNDNCYIEQKNWSVVRRLVGYARFEAAALPALDALYGLARDHVNFLQPVRKLVAKSRDGARTKRVYDVARTPFQRLLADDTIDQALKARLAVQDHALHPVRLKLNIEAAQQRLYKRAVGEGGFVRTTPAERKIYF